MTVAERLFALFAVIGAPLAWVGQLVLGYAFEETACAPGDGEEVWAVGVRTMHAVVGSLALAVALAALLCAVALRTRAASGDLEPSDRSFLGSFAIAGAIVFLLTIVLTGIGSTVLATCHGG